jgi:hypothetical protein
MAASLALPFGHELAHGLHRPVDGVDLAEAGERSVIRRRVSPPRQSLRPGQHAARRSGSADLSGTSSPTVRSPDLTGVGPGSVRIVSPDIFCRSRMLICDIGI